MQKTSLKNELSPKDFRRLSDLVHGEFGIKMPSSKKTMLESRIRKRVLLLGMNSLRDYCDYLFSREGLNRELVHMIDSVTTNKTDFFREPAHFSYLTNTALHTLINDYGAGIRKELIVWSAGCSSGEEPYTLAMVLSEFAKKYPGFRFMILATDISTRVLQAAKLAVYEEEKTYPIPPALKAAYLMKSRDKSRGLLRVVPELRKLVEFRRLNFMDHDFGIREMIDIIFCRNVIIYFDRQTQERLLNKFSHYLNPEGFIFMGHSETLHGLNVPLISVAPTVYRKME